MKRKSDERKAKTMSGYIINTRKKVCIFSAQYLPNMGGVERYVHNMATLLAKKGVEVTIVTSTFSKNAEVEFDEQVKVYRIPSLKLMNGRFPVAYLNRSARKILGDIKNEKYDLVITNTRFYFLSLIGVIIGKKCGKRNIVIEHGTSHVRFHSLVLDKLEEIYEHAMTFAIKRYTKEFYGVSEACNEWLRHFHIHAKSTLYNAIDVKNIKNIIQNNDVDIRERYGICNEATVICFTGRLLKEKGVYQLLDSFEKLQEKYSNLTLIIAGDGPEKSNLEQKNVKNVVLTGQLCYEDVMALLKASDLFCLPTAYPEGMPTSVLEAIACECFVITTQKGGSKEIIIDNNYGIIMDNNSVENIVAAVEKVLNNHLYLREAVIKCYQRLVNNFTWDIVVEKVTKLM